MIPERNTPSYLEALAKRSHHDVKVYFNQISDAIQKIKGNDYIRLPVPDVAIFSKVRRKQEYITCSYPKGSIVHYSGLETNTEHPGDSESAYAWYDNSTHTVFLPDQDVDKEVKIEEATHAAYLPFERFVYLTPDELKEHEYQGRSLYQKRGEKRGLTSENDYIIDMSEFFPPIMISLLQFGSIDRFKFNKLKSLLKERVSKKSNREEVQNDHVRSFYAHIPYYAAYAWLDAHDNNAEAFLREHGDIFNLDGQQLWETYCVPVFKS